jgi:hypothetical protein
MVTAVTAEELKMTQGNNCWNPVGLGNEPIGYIRRNHNPAIEPNLR